ncbi:MAG TPA: lysine exporter LysO family protein [Treponemataceae bacterium]|nr:lysine exporter LysO family protein [Treponemataceae bacterium]
MALGFVLAKTKLLLWNSIFEKIFSLALFSLLFSMGLRLGQSRDVLSQLPLIGLLAFFGTIFACGGTIIFQLCMIPVYRVFDSKPDINFGIQEKLTDRHKKLADSYAVRPKQSISKRLAFFLYNMKKPGILLLLVFAGTGVGLILPHFEILSNGTVATWILYALLFLIGIQMACGDSSLKASFSTPAVLLVPIVTVLGSLAGSLILLVFYDITPGQALALGSGFGWYSLSGVLIADLGYPMLGAAAFLSNLLRETLAFIVIPLLRPIGRWESGIGIAGATSMDVTLPVLEDTWGAQIIPFAVVHGVILSFLVPFLVPFVMTF